MSEPSLIETDADGNRVEDLEILQSTAIRIHDKVEAAKRHGASAEMSGHGGIASLMGTLTDSDSIALPGFHTPSPAHSRASSYSGLHSLASRLRVLSGHSKGQSHEMSERSPSGLTRQVSLGSHRGPGHVTARDQGQNSPAMLPPVPDIDGDDSRIGTAVSRYDEEEDDDSDESDYGEDDHITMPEHVGARRQLTLTGGDSMISPLSRDFASRSSPRWDQTFHEQASYTSPPSTPNAETGLLPPPPVFAEVNNRRLSATPSMLSVSSVVGEKTDFNLQKVDPFFTDSTGEFYRAFEKKLEGLNGSNSESATCIEEFLVKSEKKWFDSFRNAKLGRYHLSSARSSLQLGHESRGASAAPSVFENSTEHADFDGAERNSLADEFLLGKDYVPPTGLKKWMQLRVGDWPIYAFFMGFGQIIAANSYQITLLTGEVGQTADKLYAIASIYLATSVMWWLLFRRFSSVLCLSLPFFFYGLAFILIGLAHYASTSGGRGWVQNVGTGFYAIASSSGSMFFALNFGDEGGAQVKAWVFRACVIQGTQQIYVVALWYWGSYLNRRTMAGITQADPIASTWKITAITLPIAVLLWVIGAAMWFGLPNYYRQAPGKMPSFYKSLLRRKIVLWFFVTVIIQNFFLSAPYGRNWAFLWSSNHAATWQIVLLVALFFIAIWAVFLWIFGYLSKSHSWILPLFAIGLGAPRWAQIWWGTSNIGLYLPWAGGYTASALWSRALWLWLGTLDAIQGVGLGMILLGTLTRVHVAFTLVTAQVLGSLATIVARACAPNKIGPGPISPDISGGVGTIFQAWFWIGLILNLSICVGYFMVSVIFCPSSMTALLTDPTTVLPQRTTQQALVFDIFIWDMEQFNDDMALYTDDSIWILGLNWF